MADVRPGPGEAQDDLSPLVVHLLDPEGLAADGVHAATRPDLVLLGWEAVAEGAPLLVHHADELQHGQRLGLLPQLLIGEALQEVEVAPPRRLLLSPMPLQELCREPAPSLRLIPARGVLRQPGRQVRLRLAHQRQPVAERLRRIPIPRTRPRELHAHIVRERRPLALQPVPELPRRDDVIPVVALDASEGLVIPAGLPPDLQPGLEGHDGRAGVLQVHLPVVAVQRLQLLDGVGLHANAQALADDPEEVHEDLAAHEAVHLLLTGGVAAHEPAQVAGLVGGVVVHVQAGVRIQPPDDAVDGLLEGPLLRLRGDAAALVPCPDRVEDGLSIRTSLPEIEEAEEVVHAVVQGEGISLQVQEQVVGAGFRQRQQAFRRVQAAVVGGDEGQALEGDAAGCVRLHLEACLLPDTGERIRAGALQPRAHRQRQHGQAAPRGDGTLLELRAGAAGHARHEREVIVHTAPVRADGPPAAHVAMLHGVRVGGWRRRVLGGERRPDRLQEATFHRAVVGRIRGDAERGHLPRAAAKDDVHPLRVPALDPAQVLAVGAQLEDGRRLHAPRQLRVRHLIRPGEGGRGRFHTQQEIRESEPRAVEEAGLEDDVIPAPDGLRGALGPRAQLRTPVLQPRVAPGLVEVRDSPTRGGQVRLVALLVLVAALPDAVQLRVRAFRSTRQARQGGALQVREVAAGEEADEVRGGVDGPPIDELHLRRWYVPGVPARVARPSRASSSCPGRRSPGRVTASIGWFAPPRPRLFDG